MPKFAANLSMLYQELPFLDRFGAVAKGTSAGLAWIRQASGGDQGK